MLDIDKVRLMTDLAVYEKKNSRTVFEINNYYRHDYIMGQLLGAFVRYLICMPLCFILYLIFQAGALFYNINVSGLTSVLTDLSRYFLAGLAIYMLIAFFIASARYKRSKRGMLLYATKLKRLGRKYGKR
ncbi:MAG TPA: hypothetical protein IAB09_05715 [Candidatus Avilachnospira avicola]|nr:hypothetical protein [Candidatus Avilachnospira avicola]